MVFLLAKINEKQLISRGNFDLFFRFFFACAHFGWQNVVNEVADWKWAKTMVNIIIPSAYIRYGMIWCGFSFDKNDTIFLVSKVYWPRRRSVEGACHWLSIHRLIRDQVYRLLGHVSVSFLLFFFIRGVLEFLFAFPVCFTSRKQQQQHNDQWMKMKKKNSVRLWRWRN